jgi:hypothetical protein
MIVFSANAHSRENVELSIILTKIAGSITTRAMRLPYPVVLSRVTTEQAGTPMPMGRTNSYPAPLSASTSFEYPNRPPTCFSAGAVLGMTKPYVHICPVDDHIVELDAVRACVVCPGLRRCLQKDRTRGRVAEAGRYM